MKIGLEQKLAFKISFSNKFYESIQQKKTVIKWQFLLWMCTIFETPSTYYLPLLHLQRAIVCSSHQKPLQRKNYYHFHNFHHCRPRQEVLHFLEYTYCLEDHFDQNYILPIWNQESQSYSFCVVHYLRNRREQNLSILKQKHKCWPA